MISVIIRARKNTIILNTPLTLLISKKTPPNLWAVCWTIVNKVQTVKAQTKWTKLINRYNHRRNPKLVLRLVLSWILMSSNHLVTSNSASSQWSISPITPWVSHLCCLCLSNRINLCRSNSKLCSIIPTSHF